MNRYTSKEIIKLLEQDGWQLVSQKGSHKQFRHPTKLGKVQVPDHGTQTLEPKTASSILKQAGPK